MTHVILLCASILLLFLAIHPFLTYGLSLRLMRRFGLGCPAQPVPGAGRPVRSFAICVAAYNEERVIGPKLDNLLALRRATPWPVDILVYVDAARDRTAEIVAAYGDQVRAVVASERRGKTAGMNRLVAMTDADVVVFTDANVMLHPDALLRLEPHFADPAVGCVCGTLDYVNGADSATAAVGAAYWRHEEGLKRLESETGGVIGADGSIFAIRRSLHRPVPDDIIDDFAVSLSILCAGHRVVRAADVRAAETAATESADEFRRKVRIACQAFNVHRLMRPKLRRLHWTLRYKYLCHKLLRWLCLVDAAAAGLACTLGLGLWLGWQTALLPPAAGTLALAVVLAARRPREALLAMLATTLGLVRSLRGERFQTWDPPLSRDFRPTGS